MTSDSAQACTYLTPGLAIYVKYLRYIEEEIIGELKTCQTKIGWCAAMRNTPKYSLIDDKVKGVLAALYLLKQDAKGRDMMIDTLRKLKTHDISEFMENTVDQERAEELKKLEEMLVPYKKVIPMLEETRGIENHLVAQAKLKKLALVYDEIYAGLKKVDTMTKGLPARLKAVVDEIITLL
jgi:hypothetical protein